MSGSKYKWYRDAVWLLRDYPALKARKRDAQEASLIAAYGEKMPHGNNTQRTTENLALREISPLDEARLDVVEQAVREMEMTPDGATVIRIVEMMDWRRTHTADGVALVMHLSRRSVIRKREKLIKLIARKCGWI